VLKVFVDGNTDFTMEPFVPEGIEVPESYHKREDRLRIVFVILPVIVILLLVILA